MGTNGKKMTIYLNDEDRDQIKKLFTALGKQGVDFKDARGKLSVSELFRHLRKKEIARLEESK